jgi:hypothetical protein
MFQMCGVFAEFERETIRERVNAGIARAKRSGTKSGSRIGRRERPCPRCAGSSELGPRGEAQWSGAAHDGTLGPPRFSR